MSYPQPLPGNNNGGRWRLQALKSRINAEHDSVEQALRSTLEHALNCGELLEQAKEVAGHGNWERWRDEHFEGSPATAQLYQQLWRNRGLLVDPETQCVRDLSLREARRIISRLPDSDDDPEGKPSDEETTKERSKKGGSKKGPKGPGRCDPLAAEIYSVGDLPVPESKIKVALGDGRAVALRSDAPSGAEKALEAAKSCLEDVVRGTWAAGYDARLVLLFSSSVSGLERGFPAVENAVALEGDEEPPSEAVVAQHERRELREVDKGEPTLYQAVKEQGGVKLPRAGRRDEYDKVPLCYLGKNGLSGDEMADQLASDYPQFGITDEDSLLAALGARRKAA